VSKEKVKILFALQVVGQPRHSKRIAMLQEAGFSVEAIAFERKHHKGRIPNCPVRVVGEVEHGHYLVRALKMLAAIPSIRRAIRLNNMVYAFGPDLALICLLSGVGLGRPLVLEIGDIRNLQTAMMLKGRIVRSVEKLLTDSCCLLVATAPGFIDDYYRRWIGTKTPALIIENKLESSMTTSMHCQRESEKIEGVPLVDRPIKIGYFGLLRCNHSWQILEQLASTRPQEIEIIIAGMPVNPKELPKQAEQYANIEYRGQYRSPEDLPSLYDSVDIVWACYPFPRKNDHNWRWAKTNRFYESCYYQKPMISLEGSGDALEVERHSIGIIVPNAGVEEIIQTLDEINSEHLWAWRANMTKLPRDMYIYTTEANALKQALTDIAAGREESTHG
jgi:succinoglycan biosynthesis protein ExoL